MTITNRILVFTFIGSLIVGGILGTVNFANANQSPSNPIITDAWLNNNGPIAYEPLEGVPWKCWTNLSLGTTCPNVRTSSYPLPYCNCNGFQLNPNYYHHLYQRTYPTADVGVLNQMNYKTAQGQWVTNGQILYSEEIEKCYDAYGNLVAECPTGNHKSYVNDYDCTACPE